MMIEFAKFRWDAEEEARAFLEIERKDSATVWKTDPNGRPLGVPLTRAAPEPLLPGQHHEDEMIEDDAGATLHRRARWPDWLALADVQSAALAVIRAEAGRRILAVAPEYRQRNLTARAAEIALFEPQPWSEEIQAELSAGAAVWAAIKAVRAASDVAEAAILAATTAEEAASVTADWPE